MAARLFGPCLRLSRAMALLVVATSVAACTTPNSRESTSPTTGKAVSQSSLDRADAARIAGYIDAALGQYQVVLQADPENPRARLGVGEIYLATGQIASAEDMFTAALGTAETQAAALQGLGMARLAATKPAEARESLAAAVELDPSLWRAWNALGQLHDGRGEWADAHHSYDMALAIEPRSAIVHNNYGFSLLLQGTYAEAVEHLSKAVMLDRSLEAARMNLRLALAWQGKYDQALAGARPEEMARVLNNIGYVALLRHDYAAAEKYLTQAMTASASYYAPASRNLSHLKSILGQQTDFGGAETAKHRS